MEGRASTEQGGAESSKFTVCQHGSGVHSYGGEKNTSFHIFYLLCIRSIVHK